MTPRSSERRGAGNPEPACVLETPLGPAHAYLHLATARPVVATLVLGHGAGRGSDTRDLLDLAAGLPAAGISVIRFDQPWVVAGRRVAPAPAVLDRSLAAALPQLPVSGALVLGGRSAGARVACRTARALGAGGVVALAFPLHPPGHPERNRGAELRGAGVPVLVLQGERDAFGGWAEIAEAASPASSAWAASDEGVPIEVVAVSDADHALRGGLAPALVELVGDRIRRWANH